MLNSCIIQNKAQKVMFSLIRIKKHIQLTRILIKKKDSFNNSIPKVVSNVVIPSAPPIELKRSIKNKPAPPPPPPQTKLHPRAPPPIPTLPPSPPPLPPTRPPPQLPSRQQQKITKKSHSGLELRTPRNNVKNNNKNNEKNCSIS